MSKMDPLIKLLYHKYFHLSICSDINLKDYLKGLSEVRYLKEIPVIITQSNTATSDEWPEEDNE